MEKQQTLLELQNVEKSFNNINVIKKINLEIKKRRNCCYHRPIRLWKKYNFKMYELT